MSCLQAIQDEDTENPFICHIMNLLWLLSDKGTPVRFCWITSHCGIEGNERVDQVAKETIDHDINPLTNVHYGDLKPLVNFYIQQLVSNQMICGCTWQRYLSLETNTRATQEIPVLNQSWGGCNHWLRIGHWTTKSHILSRRPPPPAPTPTCHHCGQTLTIDHMFLECAELQKSRDEYYTADSLNTLFETIPETCIVEFLQEAGFFYLIWMVRHSIQFPTRIISELMQFVILN